MENNLQPFDVHYRKIFETARHGILIIASSGRKIVDANNFVCEILNRPRAELLGKNLAEVFPIRNPGVLERLFEDEAFADSSRCEDIALETHSGMIRDLEILAVSYELDQEVFIQCNIFDITLRKREEAERAQMLRSAAALEKIAGKVARLGGWTIDLPERKLTWSDENCSIHEVPPGYLPTLEEGIGYFPPEYREEVIRLVNRCAEDGTPYDFELPKYTAKGRLIWVRSIGEAVRDADGSIIRLQGAFQDITERKRADQEREKLIEELREALAEVKTLREFLPICSYCKKVRDDQDYWTQIETYLSHHTKFTHGICPDCYETEAKPQLDRIKKRKQDKN